jgi:hypothetical protein
MAMTPCPTDAALLPIALGETAAADLREHLDACPDCRSRLARLSSDLRALPSDLEASGAGPTRLEPGRSVSETAPTAGATRIAAPTMIGRYVVVGQLDEGGQGLVYRAVHPDLRRDVVIKLARGSLTDIEGDLLRNDGRILAGLRHENLVEVYDLDVHEGRPFLAMELVRGCTLAQRAAQRRYAPREAAALVAAVARAVAYLDARGIVHQDIKPRNIMIDEAGRPRLIDFGLAQLHDIWSGGAVGPVGGTYAFMAPEQAAGDADRIGPATDVFALGGVLLFLLTGRAPNEGGDADEVRERARLGLVDRAALSAPGIPGRLGRIAQYALATDPAERPTASELAAELGRFARGDSRRVALAAGLAVALAAVGAVWWNRDGIRTIADPDPLRPGSTWVGSYYWTSDPDEYKHPFVLKIATRRGDRFEGTCEGVDDGEFAYRIRGTIQGGFIQWRYLEQLRGKRVDEATREGALVEGQLKGNIMKLHYSDPDAALYELRLREPAE